MAMSIVTGDRYLDFLVKFVDHNAGQLLDGTLTLKLNPVGLHYVQSRLEALRELEGLISGAPVDYLRAYVSDLGDHRALEQLRRILRLLTSLKVVSVLPPPIRDPTPLSLLPFGRLKVLELRGCDLSSSAAKGLLELRHTLEKLICHNSTDALRHVFASRIVDIKDSPVWTRLSYVSCAFNGLVLMDESLQLLPVVETLDLSRNQFAKVANLRKCLKLQLLDLGFNHLRSIASLGEVASRIVKLVLRNNALTTLHGIENLKSVEGLDLSYNIISSLAELEILASLPCLHSLWLEGNPLCCARWYRARVFSFFSHPEKLSLDENPMNTKEFWERQIILASRQKQPSGYGFYFPAKDDAEDGSHLNAKRKTYCRLASIQDEEQRSYMCSEAADQESVSCISENQSKEENGFSDDESEIVNLMNKIEYMKRERSVLWLRELKDWMDQTHDHAGEKGQCTRKCDRLLGESSCDNPVIGPISEDINRSNVLELDISCTDTSTVNPGNGYFHANGKVSLEDALVKDDEVSETSSRIGGRVELNQVKVHSGKPHKRSPLGVKISPHSSLLVDTGGDKAESISSEPFTIIDEVIGSRPSSLYPGSPPHYQEHILQRRLYLEEEFLQLSAESQSLVSSNSDSDTSCSEDDISGFNASIAELDHLLINGCTELDRTHKLGEAPCKENHLEGKLEELNLRNNLVSAFGSCSRPDFNLGKYFLPNQSKKLFTHDSLDEHSCSTGHSLSQYNSGMKKHKGKQKLKRRMVSIPGNPLLCEIECNFQKANGILEIRRDAGRDNGQTSYYENAISEFCEGASGIPFNGIGMDDSVARHFSCNPDQYLFVKDFFHLEVADSGSSEDCQAVVRCECIYQLDSVFHKSEIALLRSSKNKLYLLLIDHVAGCQETVLKVLGSYRLEELREVVVGLGLQVLRVYMEEDATYLFLPRTSEKCEDLIFVLGIGNSSTSYTRCSLRSWEQVQVKLLQKYICGSIKMSIVFYSMVQFWHEISEGESWGSRSLFVIEGYLLICIEDLVNFSCLTDDTRTFPPYYCLDMCCPIQNLLEMVIELNNNRCLTLTAHNVSSNNIFLSGKSSKERQPEKSSSRGLTWKLKWFSEETLLKFVVVLKAINLGLTARELPVKRIS